MSRIVFLFISVSVFLAVNAELPSYIQKCKRNDPKFNECLLDRGNVAVRKLLYGDENLGLPSLLPISLPRILLTPTNNFLFDLREVNAFGFEALKIDDIKMDLKKHTFEIQISGPESRWEANYNATGILFDKSFDHTGQTNITFESFIIHYSADYAPVDIDGDYYFQVKNGVFSMNTKNIVYKLSPSGSSTSNEASNLMNIFNEKEDINKELLPTAKVIGVPVISNIVNLVLKSSPMCELFD